MSIRIDLGEDTLSQIKVILDKNIKDIFLHTRLKGSRRVENWQDFLTKESIPEINDDSHTTNMINFSGLNISQKMQPIIQKYFKDKVVRPTGFFHYPDTGYMGWHTNSNNACKRLYITYVEEAGKSFFRYLKDDKVITDYDDKGFTVRMFDVAAQEPYFWHCVGSEIDRLSFGFSVK